MQFSSLNLSMKPILIILILSTIFFYQAYSGSNFYYQRNIRCLHNTPQQCIQWNQTTSMMMDYSWGVQTYHEHTLVHSQQLNGPKQMKHLKIGQRILAHDYISGWFIRDHHAQLELHRLHLNNGFSYLMNGHQNIAVINQDQENHLNQQVNFMEAHLLEKSKRQLHSLNIFDNHKNQQNIYVSHLTVTGQMKHGLFSPYVHGMNFYIYPQETHHQLLTNKSEHKNKNHQYPLILSHCSSNINFDHNTFLRRYQHFIALSMKFFNHLWFLNINYDQNHHLEQAYSHPVNHLIGFFIQNQDHSQQQQQHLSHKRGIKVGHQYYYGSSYYGSSYYGSSDYQRQKQRQLLKTVLVIGLLQMDQQLLITS